MVYRLTKLLIGSNGHVYSSTPCFKRQKALHLCYHILHHISHSMLGHTVALSSLEKIVNAFTVFSQVSQNRHNFIKNILAPCFQRGLQQIARRVFLACFQVSGMNVDKFMIKIIPSAVYSAACYGKRFLDKITSGLKVSIFCSKVQYTCFKKHTQGCQDTIVQDDDV